MRDHNEIVNEYNKRLAQFVKELECEMQKEIDKNNNPNCYVYVDKAATNITFSNELFHHIKCMTPKEYNLFSYVINNIDKNNNIKLNRLIISKIINKDINQTSTCLHDLIKKKILIKDRHDKELYHLNKQYIRKGIDRYTLEISCFCDEF